MYAAVRCESMDRMRRGTGAGRSVDGVPRRRLRRIWAAVWLPLLLVLLVVLLEPSVNEFALGLILLVVALATTWLGDAVRGMRARRRP